MHADWPAENIVLALLCERPMHGYELAQLVKSDAALRAIWRIELSEVYFLLRKLLKLGFIVEHAEEDGEPRPRRVLYTPTPSGQAALGGVAQPRLRSTRATSAQRCWLASTWHCDAIRRWRCNSSTRRRNN